MQTLNNGTKRVSKINKGGGASTSENDPYGNNEMTATFAGIAGAGHGRNNNSMLI